MKKLMVMVAAVAVAAVTQAASFSWQVSTGETYPGMNVYCIQGTTAEAVISAFSAQDSAAKWTAPVSGVTPVVSGTSGARATAKGTSSGITDGDNLVFAIIDGDIAEGNNWYVLADYTVPSGTTYTPPTSGKAQVIALNVQSSGTFTLTTPGPTPPDPAPEPTSGLLLMLGMAGLALRRKMK